MKNFSVKVNPGAKRNSIKEENGIFKVYLTAQAVNGKANTALILYLSEHFKIKKKDIKIIKGLKARTKVVSINA